MAEVNKIVNRSNLHFKLQDGSGSPLSYTFKLAGPPVYMLNLPQESEAVMGQQGGTSVIEAIAFNGVQGPGTFTIVIFAQDPSNSTDATALEWVTQMEKNTFSGGLSTFTSTNSLPLTGKSTALGTLTFENVGSSNADHTFAADMYIESVGSSQVINGAIAHEVVAKVVEAWTRAIV